MDTVSNNNTKHKVFTVIVTYNAKQWIKNCVDSVINNTTVVIVDNQSSDDTLEFIAKHYHDIVILKQNHNLGFGRANNIGISYALSKKAEFVLLLNQDAKLGRGAIYNLLEASANYKNYGIISPIHCDWKGEFLETSFSNYLSQNNNRDFYSDYVLGKPKKTIYDVPFVAAACWFLTSQALLAVGGFDPIFKHLGEDVNLIQRLKYHGFKVGVLPSCKVYHDTSNRPLKKIEKYSEDYFYKFDYRSKMKYADLNTKNWFEKLEYAKNQVRKELVFALLKLNFTHVNGAIKQLKKLNLIKLQCEESREITEERGSHYLNY